MSLEEFSQSGASLADLTPHSCSSCESLVFAFHNNIPTTGYFYTGEYGRKFFMFNLWMNDAMQAAERGCTFVKRIINSSTVIQGDRLRASFSEYGSGAVEVYFEWVDKEDDSLLGGDAMTICSTEGTSFRKYLA
jgi:hypothetical protein